MSDAPATTLSERMLDKDSPEDDYDRGWDAAIDKWVPEVAALEVEVARLREANDHWHTRVGLLNDERDALRDEAARLREELKYWRLAEHGRYVESARRTQEAVDAVTGEKR